MKIYAEGGGDGELLDTLFLDSEGPVSAEHTVWEHLKAWDNWDQPEGTTDNQAFLMVQLMETWFVADREMLQEHFGASFGTRHLKEWPALEEVPKGTILDALDKATAASGRAQYAKGKVSFLLLEKLNPKNVEAARPHAKDFLNRLRSL